MIKAVCDERARWLASNALPHEGALRSWLSSRRLPGLEIDDIIQDTYARLIQADLGAVRNPKAYMYQTAWSVLVTHVRRERVVSIQTLADVDQLALETDAPGPEQQAADHDELRRLSEAIATLPGKVGAVISLRRVHGLPQREVAARLGLAESTVEKHMRRGLLLLLEHFARGGSVAVKTSMIAGQEIRPCNDQKSVKRNR